MADQIEGAFDKANVVQLKSMLGLLGLSTVGTKALIKTRLVDAYRADENVAGILANAMAELNAPRAIENDGESINDGESSENVQDESELDRKIECMRRILEKKKMVADLRRQISEIEIPPESTVMSVSESGRNHLFNFKDIENSIQKFTGDDNLTIAKWLQLFEETADLLDWNVMMKFVYAKRLMAGTAKLFLRTVTNIKSWPQLKTALSNEFEQKVSTADIHTMLRNRKKKRDESVRQYVLTMQEIASLAEIDDTDLLYYIVNGIPDSTVNKTLLYAANSLAELKLALQKYEKMKTSLVPRVTETTSTTSSIDKAEKSTKPQDNTDKNPFRRKCYNCNEFGHFSADCPKPKRTKNSCYRCGEMGHLAPNCTNNRVNVVQKPCGNSNHPGDTLSVRNKQSSSSCGQPDNQRNGYVSDNDFERLFSYRDENQQFSCKLLTLLDSGSPISFMQRTFVPTFLVADHGEDENFCGLNNSKLEILGSVVLYVNLKDSEIKLNVFIVKNQSMKYPVILGRDFLKTTDMQFSSLVEDDKAVPTNDDQLENNADVDFLEQIMTIDIGDDTRDSCSKVEIGEIIPFEIKNSIIELIDCDASSKSSDMSNINSEIELKINLTSDKPFFCTPRRLPYAHKIELQNIIDDLLKRQVIRVSNSPYASAVVLVQKKDGKIRLCIDYRSLNKITVRDNYPLPLIEDLLDRLGGKMYFTTIDLREGFHHVRVAEDSVKFTSFVTPMGQYEYVRMPFGLKNAPSVFQRYINNIFRYLIEEDKLFVYMDDLLIATETVDEHLAILKNVMDLVRINCLRLRYDKCKFMLNRIVYLGYIIDSDGIRPNDENMRAIKEYPIPTNTKNVHGFLGLCSYFRKFIQNFAVIAKPLYDLVKKDTEFVFGSVQLETFQMLKDKLLATPILSIYGPNLETELHCDASSIGFGAILLQRQNDGRFHPVFYFSKRTTDVESRYHSYELETLAIVYALRRFRVYLIGVRFKIVTDCLSLTLTLNKKLLNPRIHRWALEMQSFDYTIEHRSSNRMTHVDALSRCSGILVIEEGDSFETLLAVEQRRDPIISEISAKLESGEDEYFALINGLVYRKSNDRVTFYVPRQMEQKVIQTHHESLCHLGIAKCHEYIGKTYWFPGMRAKIGEYVKSCLKCVQFSTISGKPEGELHNIPRGNVPFGVIHIDHYGPLPLTRGKFKYIFLVVDGFTKFSKLYAVKSTTAAEVIDCLKLYFRAYSRPRSIVSDRGTCFTSRDFSEFASKNNIVHIKVATLSPQSNGQVERINRIVTPMLSKEADENTTSKWYTSIEKIEFALNNTVNRSTGHSPSVLLFGVDQKGDLCDRIREKLLNDDSQDRNIGTIREEASASILKNQTYNKNYYDSKHKAPHKYKVGDYVVIRNVVTTAGLNRKLLPKYRGPYEVIEVFENDRYKIKDIAGIQISRLPYQGICSPANMKPYVCCV